MPALVTHTHQVMLLMYHMSRATEDEKREFLRVHLPVAQKMKREFEYLGAKVIIKMRIPQRKIDDIMHYQVRRALTQLMHTLSFAPSHGRR